MELQNLRVVLCLLQMIPMLMTCTTFSKGIVVFIVSIINCVCLFAEVVIFYFGVLPTHRYTGFTIIQCLARALGVAYFSFSSYDPLSDRSNIRVLSALFVWIPLIAEILFGIYAQMMTDRKRSRGF
ncbi:hypothetical protein BLNAU_11491 [Blattamonas nauphoetae]|uniref:Uncharacterized protein n=1 Tax=Blattamonas nauphoetae TaxID=2049346 RepID=A0ABQ9XN67_9EUKA|nr:hypothetical protein BLNAU_11491 [Blattamonas nauphoetae]